MKNLFIFYTILSFLPCFSQENWQLKKPLFEYHNSVMGRDSSIHNTFSILEQPKVRAGYGNSVEYSINKFLPFSKAHHIAKNNEGIIYEQYYEGDRFGLRIIPGKYIPTNAETHLIVAGDSNTFGDGVSIENTLPVLLSKNIPESRPYNWGIRGGGPNNTLAMMEFLPWDETIKEKKGLFIYNYYDFLIERVIGFKNYILWTDGTTPYYKLNDEGVAVHQGNFNQRFLTHIFKAMNSVKWMRDLFPILPRPRYEHSVILGKVFLKMRDEYKKKFPEGQFYVAINNNFHRSLPGRLEELQIELKKNKVPFIVVPHVTYDDEYLFKDFHLNPKGHKLEADLLLKVFLLNKIAGKPDINATDHNQMKNLRYQTHLNLISSE